MPEILWTGAEIAAVTGGELRGDFSASGISIDTRTLQPGDLFIALKGPNFDGHEFIAAALEKGAAGILAEHGTPDNTVLVKDAFLALQDLGEGARARSKATIIAVTGSVGKTSVKAMLHTAFSVLGPTHAAEASLNNHWGVPLSLARMPRSAQYAVFEIGMNHAGEISPLSKMVAPHVAIITAIAPAHIAYLGSIENIALAKAEIFHGMDANGIAILPRDSQQFPLLLAEARTQGLQHILNFGESPDADIRLKSVQGEGDASLVTARIGQQDFRFTFGVPGKHQALNLLSVLAALSALDKNIQDILPAFAGAKPVAGRGNRRDVPVVGGNITVIDETHNASPIAVEAALDLLGQTQTGRRVVILGDMLELGPDAAAFHAGLADGVKKSGAGIVLLSGPLMASLASALPKENTRHYADSAALAKEIPTLLGLGDIVLVKGSRGSKMKLVVDAIVQLGQLEKSPETLLMQME
ncbi:MAG: UDP-N-acetylmuramoylalanyl-D-glutamyl-2,6-diaminopimelate--D-alanyl-D-alanine ligase [Alphaproteobacteria bacterium]|nr:UDP-N-acetylmuramoylalanyl-D-glutamyl-2,6-diaminopimelate--D-alanyl-D-alanine ligase [Alphaproteobacteria bacterium]